MDFALSQEDNQFRQEVRDFMATELPDDWKGIPWVGEPAEETEEALQFAKSFTNRMRDRGWLTMHWPVEYGGEGASPTKQLIVAEEVGYANAPLIDIYGPSIVGLTLINFGTEEQKKEHLPKIKGGEVLWTQGFSEPDAGSDLASLRTSAKEEGDFFILNGQKTWSSVAHFADWMFLLVRTDPDAEKNYKGISLLYVDMKTPGITTRPIINIAGGHTFNEVFFDDVKVPKDYLIGERNKGFYIAMASLDYERSGGIQRAAQNKRTIDNLVKYVNERKRAGETIPDEALVRERLAQSAIDVEISRLLGYRIIHEQSKGEQVTYEASMQFAFMADLTKRLNRLSTQILGLYGQLGMKSEWAHMHGVEQRAYLHTPAFSLAGGTTEIQRNVVAWRGLGLPRV